MAQFDVYENTDVQSRKRTPYLLDIQSDILESLSTRVVVPLRAYTQDQDAVISKLHPVIQIGEKRMLLLLPNWQGSAVRFPARLCFRRRENGRKSSTPARIR